MPGHLLKKLWITLQYSAVEVLVTANPSVACSTTQAFSDSSVIILSYSNSCVEIPTYPISNFGPSPSDADNTWRLLITLLMFFDIIWFEYVNILNPNVVVDFRLNVYMYFVPHNHSAIEN